MRTLLNQIKSEMEILTMKERVLIYVQEKQSVEDSNILVQASIAFARQEGFSIAGIVTEISYEGHMSDAAFMTVASMAEDLEVDKVLVLIPDMVHSSNMEVVLRNQVLMSVGSEFLFVTGWPMECRSGKEIIIPFPVQRIVHRRPEFITTKIFKEAL